MRKSSNFLRGLLIVVVLMPASGWAQQRVQLPTNTADHRTAFQGAAAPGYIPPGPAPLSPVPPIGTGTTGGSTFVGPGSGATLGAPAFDGFSTSGGAAGMQPSLATPPLTNPYGGTLPQGYGAPGYGAPANPYYGPQGGDPYPGYQQQPPALFPNGFPSPGYTGTPGAFPTPLPGPYLRLFSDLRATYTWVRGGDRPTDLDIQDIEAAVSMNYPNFLYSSQPLRISPEFIFHFWDGPITGAGDPLVTADLPSRAYSTFLNFRWDPRFSPQFGAELDTSVGVFTDYQTLTSDSIRILGTGLLVFNLTPTLTLKGGVTYLDRLEWKLLPAGGILWTPNPHTKFDIFFPRPKLAQYLTTLGNTDVWWYLGGEIGGGNWTVRRAVDDMSDRVDINDLRVMAGLEWTHFSGCRGFIEGGYVFNREVVYDRRPQDNFEPRDTYMLRAGLAY